MHRWQKRHRDQKYTLECTDIKFVNPQRVGGHYAALRRHRGTNLHISKTEGQRNGSRLLGHHNKQLGGICKMIEKFISSNLISIQILDNCLIP